MIVSHEHRFIFIKNRKVGSTSTELALQKICGPDDIVTPDRIYAPNAGPNPKDALVAGSRNWRGTFNPLREASRVRRLDDVVRVFRDRLYRPTFYNHMRATSVRDRVPTKVWNSYYKFCFDRNPWDKVVSFYFWNGRHAPGKMPDLDTFITSRSMFQSVDQALPSDWVRYADGNQIIVDDVFDFDDLSQNLATALRRAGVSETEISAAQVGQEKTKLRKPEDVVFTREADETIQKTFRREIETLDFCSRPPPNVTVKNV